MIQSPQAIASFLQPTPPPSATIGPSPPTYHLRRGLVSSETSHHILSECEATEALRKRFLPESFITSSRGYLGTYDVFNNTKFCESVGKFMAKIRQLRVELAEGEGTEEIRLFSTFCVNVKMQYTLNQRLFLVKQYWITNSITATQRAYQREFGVRNPPKRNTILGLVNKLETTGSLVSEKGKHRSSRLPTVVVDVRARLEQSPKKSLRCLSQETGYAYTMCQRA
ncbi:hypothetical protein ANN_13442 [Periplaneta americana]|uniref:DUF4817 domain-containing protein n=1 Tax=Periplaneta americana TaxID=6978 RepID=A0ABQ8TMX8_PERAM|nr:hypothetical protein ANN_13442 [Periplaneta americana]